MTHTCYNNNITHTYTHIDAHTGVTLTGRGWCRVTAELSVTPADTVRTRWCQEGVAGAGVVQGLEQQGLVHVVDKRAHQAQRLLVHEPELVHIAGLSGGRVLSHLNLD